MRTPLILLVFSLLIGGSFAPKPAFGKRGVASLPAEVEKKLYQLITPNYLSDVDFSGPSNKQTFSKRIGPPALSKDGPSNTLSEYFVINKYKYALEVKSLKGKVASINGVFLTDRPKVKKLIAFLKDNKIPYEIKEEHNYGKIKIKNQGVVAKYKVGDDYLYSITKEYR